MELRYKPECKVDTEDHEDDEVLQKQALKLHMVTVSRQEVPRELQNSVLAVFYRLITV